MIPEKMLELLVLANTIDKFKDQMPNEIFTFMGKNYSTFKLYIRYIKLQEEFLEPYVITSDEKS